MERIEQVTKYYTCLDSMKRKFDRYARKDALQATTKEQYENWSESARKKLFMLFGMDKMDSCTLEPRTLEVITLEDGIRREKIRIQVEPEVWMPCYILYPKAENQKYVETEDGKKPACAIAPHGHQGGGKESIVGRSEIAAIDAAIKKYEYDYGLELCKKGYITFCPDARGYAERREKAFQKDEEQSYLSGTCFHLAHMAEPLGMTVMGMLVWDLMRLVDYIYERGDLDVSTLACVGFSGGGMQTLMTGALDTRIQRFIISGYFYGYKDSLLLLNGNCNCNYVPHLWEHFDMGDIGALLAPREVIFQSCKGDHLNGERGLLNVTEQLEITKQAYQCYQATDNITHDIREGGHCFHKEVLYKF